MPWFRVISGIKKKKEEVKQAQQFSLGLPDTIDLVIFITTLFFRSTSRANGKDAVLRSKLLNIKMPEFKMVVHCFKDFLLKTENTFLVAKTAL